VATRISGVRGPGLRRWDPSDRVFLAQAQRFVEEEGAIQGECPGSGRPGRDVDREARERMTQDEDRPAERRRLRTSRRVWMGSFRPKVVTHQIAGCVFLGYTGFRLVEKCLPMASNTMLTIFSLPKAFKGHVGVIQRNAIESWTHLQPRPEIILLGNDEGTAEMARELGLRHLPQVARGDRGTPLLSDMFRQAEAAATSPCMCYVNADIILLSDFLRAAETVQREFGKSLLISKRINMDIPEKLDFDAGWEETIKRRASTNGREGDHTAIDVFVFPKGMYSEIPDFAIGRLWFDQWLIKAVRKQNLPVVDASLVAPVLHQNHDYNHVTGAKEQVWRGNEAQHNFRLYGGVQHAYTLLDVTHELTGRGSIRRVNFRRTIFRVKEFAWDLLVRRTVGLRDTLRLRRRFWKKPTTTPHS
jgi:hypothetical protein